MAANLVSFSAVAANLSNFVAVVANLATNAAVSVAVSFATFAAFAANLATFTGGAANLTTFAAVVVATTLLAPSFRNWLFAYHLVLKHPLKMESCHPLSFKKSLKVPQKKNENRFTNKNLTPKKYLDSGFSHSREVAIFPEKNNIYNFYFQMLKINKKRLDMHN